MEEFPAQDQNSLMENGGSVVLEIENFTQSCDKSSGSPKMSKALSRKGSYRADRRFGEDLEKNEGTKDISAKAEKQVPVTASQLDMLRQPCIQNKAIMATAAAPNCGGSAFLDGRNKRFSHVTSVHPRKILLFFATASSMGTMILIYFTLAMNRKAGL